MIWDALEWANKVNDKQGVIDCATAMGIDELRHCKGCMDGELHYENQCVVCGTHNVWTRFDVLVNPFTRESIITNPHDGFFAIKLKFNDLDDWASFTYQETIYDVHFYYDGEFSLEIYPFGHSFGTETESLTNKLEIRY